MSCNEADNSAKWTCKKCTFENYPKSIKCTMCLAVNNPAITRYIMNEATTIDDNAALKHSSNDLSSNTSYNDTNKKWNCHACTYLNYPKSIKCVQCLSVRSPDVRQTTTSQTTEEQSNCSLSPLNSISNKNELNKQDKNDLIKINNNLNTINNLNSNLSDKEIDPELNQHNQNNNQTNNQTNNQINNSNNQSNTSNTNIKPSTSTAKRIETNCDQNLNLSSNDSSSTNSLNSSSSSLNNESDKLTDNYQSTLSKWRCTACTYDNWPKSTKCILCSTPKALNTSAMNSTNTSLTNIETAICSGGDGKSITNSILTDDKLIGATSQRNLNANRLNNGLSNNNVNTIINYSLNNNRRKNREYVDWNWLEACVGVLNGDPEPVLVFLNNGGDLGRQLTLVEVNFLNKQNLVGYTLIHLAIRFKRSEILEILLENRSPNRAKRVPCTVAINWGIETRKLVNNSLKQRKGEFPCYFFNDFVNFALPQDILELSPTVQSILFEDLLDKDVQNELEESSIINWSLEINVTLGSRLYALWNRSTGDCLLDSVLQATYGVFDKDNRLRKALADSLNDAHILFNRFKEAEILRVSHQLPYTLEKLQWEEDWAVILSIASQPKCALEGFHIFVLSHILRRPIIVYGIKFVKSYRGEKLALAGFQGVYLPLHWDAKFCTKSPISLAYTKGHFTALVSMEAMSSCVMMSCNCEETGQMNNDCSNCCVSGAGNIVKNNFDTDCCYLPLVTSERELLPLQFLVKSELGRQEEIMRQYLDCCVTEEGILVCKQKLTKKPYPMQIMLNEWMDFYRNIPSMVNSKSSNEHQSNSKSTNDTTNYISDEESD